MRVDHRAECRGAKKILSFGLIKVQVGVPHRVVKAGISSHIKGRHRSCISVRIDRLRLHKVLLQRTPKLRLLFKHMHWILHRGLPVQRAHCDRHLLIRCTQGQIGFCQLM